MISSSEQETLELGKVFAQGLKKGDIVAFHGDLGTGKTTFIKGVIEALEGATIFEVQSPTFNYLNIYETQQPIYHFDLYRMKTATDFIQMGFIDYFEEEGICLIEWPSRIETLLPQTTVHVNFKHLEGDKRAIVYNC